MSNAVSLCKWWICLLAPLTLWAEDSSPPIKLQLVSEMSAITPGEPFTVGLLLKHAPHHHSYYKFPGIVGVPTNIAWTAPIGFVPGQIQWPTPEQVDMRGHGAYGYHEDTLLLIEVTGPSIISWGTEFVHLKCRVGYMCCSQERCTPGFEDLEMQVPLGEKAVPDKAWKERFTKARAALPKAIEGWVGKVVEAEKHFVLTLSPPAELAQGKLPKSEALYFYSWNGWTASNEAHQCEFENGAYTFTMPKHPFPEEGATRFQGVVRSDSGWPGEPAENLGLWLDLECAFRQK